MPVRSWPELRSLSRRCEALRAGLPVPDPFDFDEFIAALGRQRGKPLRVWEFDTGSDGGSPCGLYVGTESADHIFVAPAHSELQRQQVVVHELAHMVLGHRRKDGLSADDLSRVLPGLSLSADQVRAVMARTSYTTPEEVEAELLASVILQGSRRAARSPKVPAELREVVARINDRLG